MWLNVRWYDSQGGLVREDGAYGDLEVTLDGQQEIVRTLLNPESPHTKVYEAHMALTQEWANQLLGLGYDPGLVLSYDRVTEQPDYTLQDLANQAPGSWYESFHFVLNNHLAEDNRIPPYGYRYDDAEERNALPVPADQFGDPGPGGVYQHWDDVALSPPPGAATAQIRLMYQPTSWEYAQFLCRANPGTHPFLGDTGADLLEVWQNTGMAEPAVMATAEWNRWKRLAKPVTPAPSPSTPGTSRSSPLQ